jgi:uncharacterized membrane protein
MSKFAVVVFADERNAYRGVRVLQELHEDGTVTVDGAAVVHREETGALSVAKRSYDLPLGLGVATLVGSLIALFDGSADGGAFVHAGEGLVGGWRDHLHGGVSAEILASVVRELVPGKFAVVADVSHGSLASLDARMEALGGKVFRESRNELVHDLLENTASFRRSELAARRAERAAARMERLLSELAGRVAETHERTERAYRLAREAARPQTASRRAQP